MKEIKFDTSKLRGRIIEKYGTIKKFANAMNLSEMAIYKMLLGKNDWNRKKIIKACELLDISDFNDIKDLFFYIKS